MLKQKTLHQVIIFSVCFLAIQTDKRCTYMKNSLEVLLLLTSKSRFYYLATFVVVHCAWSATAGEFFSL